MQPFPGTHQAFFPQPAHFTSPLTMSHSPRHETPSPLSASSSHSSSSGASRRSQQKRSKKSCFYCRRAHKACDDNKPCNRCVTRGLTCSVDAPENWQAEIKQIKIKKRKRREGSTDSSSKKARIDGGSSSPSSAGSSVYAGDYVPASASSSGSGGDFSSPVVDSYSTSSGASSQHQFYSAHSTSSSQQHYHQPFGGQFHHHKNMPQSHGVHHHKEASSFASSHTTPRIDAVSSPNMFWMPPPSADSSSDHGDLLWKSGSPTFVGSRPGSAFKLTTPTDFQSTDLLPPLSAGGAIQPTRNDKPGANQYLQAAFSPCVVSPLAPFTMQQAPHNTGAMLKSSSTTQQHYNEVHSPESYHGSDSSPQHSSSPQDFSFQINTISAAQQEHRALIQNLLELNNRVISDPANPFFARFDSETTAVCILASEAYAKACSVKHPFILACNSAFASMVRAPQKTILIDSFPCYFEFPSATPFLPQNTQHILESANQLLHANVNFGRRLVKVGSELVQESFVIDGNVRYCRFDRTESDEWNDAIQLNGQSFPKSVSIPMGKDLSETQVTQAVQLFYNRLLQL